MEIRFYSTRAAYKEFSNFFRAPFKLDGEWWSTTEHYFQAMKFAGTSYSDVIRYAPTPSEAARLGKSRSHPLRRDWNQVREDVMYAALVAKFTQNPALRKLLLDTGDAKLIEDSPTDYYWGVGSKGTGKNRLGELLMELRDELREI